MSDTVQEWVFGGKCRHCGNKNIWCCGSSDSISPNSFIDSMHERLKIGTSKYCDECKGSTIHDITFYGNKIDYKKLIDEHEKN
jgi:hypothetical protein